MIKQFQAVLASDYKGPKPGYGEVDVLKAILAIGKAGTNLGRYRLGHIIGLGQGEVRTLISRLKQNNLIVVDARGIALTQSGKKEFEIIVKTIPYSEQIEALGLGLGKFAWVALVRDGSKKIRRGLEQRDAAIRAGASGALTVIYQSDKFMIPDSEEQAKASDCEAMGPKEPWTTIRSAAQPKGGDVIIVCGADTVSLAEEGALAAALTIP
ncbi:MAG: DUF4443 domain-containing protein [Nitrososphaerales archaeon]